MVSLLLLVLLLVLLFGALGVAISPLFFILLVAVLLIAGTGGRRWSSRARPGLRHRAVHGIERRVGER